MSGPVGLGLNRFSRGTGWRHGTADLCLGGRSSRTIARSTPQHVVLGAVKPLCCLRIARLETQHSPPGIGGLAGVNQLLLPQAGHPPGEISSERGITAAKDLVLEELDHPSVFAQIGVKLAQLLHYSLIRRREIMQALQILGCPWLIV